MDLQDKSTRAFMVTFAILMAIGAHYFQHNQGGSGLYLPQNNIVWIFYSILIGMGLWRIAIDRAIYYTKFTLMLFVTFLIFLIPLFYSNNEFFGQSYARLLGLLAGLLLFISLQQFKFSRKNLTALLLLIVLAGFLQSCYSFMQDYFLPAQNIFGYNVGFGRPYGIFQQPNVLASFMATSLILAGYLLFQVTNKNLKVFLLLTVMLNAWVITITVSRTGYLSLIIALLLFIPFAFQSNKKKLLLFLFAILLGISSAFVVSKYILKNEVLITRNMAEDQENSARIKFYKHCIRMIKANPLTGVGYGGFEKNYLITFAKEVAKGNSKADLTILDHPHNEVLFWAVEGGIVPVFAILFISVCFFRLFKGAKVVNYLALIALVIPIAVHTQTEYPLYHSALHWLVLIVLLFFIDSEMSEIKNVEYKHVLPMRILSVVLPIVTTVFMLTNLYTIYNITKFERSSAPDANLIYDIINPVIFKDRLEFHENNVLLKNAIEQIKPEDFKKVISWGENIIKLHPKPHYFYTLYIAYLIDGDLLRAHKTIVRGRYLFPLDPQLLNGDLAKTQVGNIRVRMLKEIDRREAAKKISDAVETSIGKP